MADLHEHLGRETLIILARSCEDCDGNILHLSVVSDKTNINTAVMEEATKYLKARRLQFFYNPKAGLGFFCYKDA